MEERKDHGLGLEVSISDAGTGLHAGIPKAFPDICIQPDIFHELRPVGAELARLERKAEKLIADEATLEKRASGKRPQKKTLERLNQIHEKVGMAIQEYDLLRILFCWLVELTGFSGYTFQDACGLAEWVLSEMEASFPGRTKLLGQTKKIREKLPQILSFLQRMEEGFAAASRKSGIPPEAFHIMYQQKAFHASSWECSQMEYRFGELLGNSYESARQEFCHILVHRSLNIPQFHLSIFPIAHGKKTQCTPVHPRFFAMHSRKNIRREPMRYLMTDVLDHTKRASSLVENLNSRIRVYMNLKRIVPEKYFILLKAMLTT